jgi:O-antigen ligase
MAAIAVTACLQYLRPSGTALDRTGLLTLVQLGILVAISAYLLRDPRRVILVGYVTIGSGVVGSLLTLADRLQLVSLGTEVMAVGYERVSGAIEDPNKAAYQLLVPLAFAINLALASKTLKTRAVFWTASAVLGAGIVSTYSAGALVGLVAVAATAVILQSRISLKRGLAALGLIVTLTVVVAATLPPGYSQAVSTKYSKISTAPVGEIGTGRVGIWGAGIRSVVANPLLGSGLSTATIQSAIAPNYGSGTISRLAAHNMYIAMAVGTGVLGLLAFLALLGSSLSGLWSAFSRAVRTDRRDAQVAAACLMTALVVTLTQGLQLDLQMEKYLWLLIGAALAVRYWSIEPRQDPSIPSQHDQ